MEKPYDLMELAAKCKAKGLDIAEAGAQNIYEAFGEWFEESARASLNPFDDMVLLVKPQIDAVVKAQIDKIDGQVG
jgi:hypothetical protein